MLGNFIDFLNDNIYTEIRKEIKYFLSLDYSWKRKKYERGDCNEEKNNSME